MTLIQKLSSITSPTYQIVYRPLTLEENGILEGEECELVMEVMKGCLERDVKKRLRLSDLLDHPYLTGRPSSRSEAVAMDASGSESLAQMDKKRLFDMVEKIVDELSCVPELSTQNLDLISRTIYEQCLKGPDQIDLSTLELV